MAEILKTSENHITIITKMLSTYISFDSENIALKKTFLETIMKSTTANLVTLNTWIHPIAEKEKMSQQTLLSTYSENDLLTLLHAQEIIYFICFALKGFFDAAKPYKLDQEDRVSLVTIPSTISTIVGEHLTQEIKTELGDIFEHYNTMFLEEKNKSFSSSAQEKKRNEDFILSKLLASHLGLFNQFLIEKFPLQESSKNSINRIKIPLEEFLNKFIPYAQRLPAKKFSSENLVTFNRDLTLVNILLLNGADV
jgi:hypothetical protein